MSHDSTAELLALHGVRLAGFADTPVIAHRFNLEQTFTESLLRDAEAHGWVQHTAFADIAGWFLTETGKAVNERQLAAELHHTGGEKALRSLYHEFLPLNALLLRACTDWQLKPSASSRLVPNDHADRVWDDGVLHELAGLNRALGPLNDRLTELLTRFRGYDIRFSAALSRARAGEHTWVDRTDVDSCHRAWFELHEDLVATLGIERQNES